MTIRLGRRGSKKKWGPPRGRLDVGAGAGAATPRTPFLIVGKLGTAPR